MRYMNDQTQFNRVTDTDARMIMESIGYQMQSATQVVTDLYTCNDRRFALSEEVVEASDDNLYIRLDELEDMAVVEVDESGREPVVDSVNFDDTEYALEGVYQDDDGALFACMVAEAQDPGDEDEEEDEEETDEETEEESEEESTEE